VLEAELPGVRQEDVDIELVGNELAISGELKEKERTGVVRRRTRRTGRFDYRVALPEQVDPSRSKPRSPRACSRCACPSRSARSERRSRSKAPRTESVLEAESPAGARQPPRQRERGAWRSPLRPRSAHAVARDHIAATGTISLACSRSRSLRADQDDPIAHEEERADDGTNEPAAQPSSLLFRSHDLDTKCGS
jgi:hypothetical protein